MTTQTEFLTGDNHRIVATEQIVAGSAATAIILHGFYSSRQSPSAQAARDGFVQQDMSVVAPDFYGRGDSDGAFGDLTIAQGVATFEAALNHVRARDPKQKIVLTGGSFGGLVALHAAARFAADVSMLVLRAPVSDWRAVWNAQLSPADWQAWEATGEYAGRLPDGRQIVFGRRFYNDLCDANVYQTIAPQIMCPTLIVHGDADETVELAQSRRLQTALHNADLVILPGADHGFSRPGDLQAYRQQIRTFIDKNS